MPPRISRKQLGSLLPGFELPKQPRGHLGHDRASDAILLKQMCLANRLPEPQKEVKFDETRNWRIDWLFDGRVALEIEGSPWAGKPCPTCGMRPGGRHNRGQGFLDDMEKYNAIATAGLILLRTTWDQINKGTIFPVIAKALEVKK